MATMKVAINGFGRIGRCILRAALARKENIEFVAINDLDAPATMAHLFKYDSVHRTWPGEVSATDKAMTVDGKTIAFTAEKDPTKLPWKAAVSPTARGRASTSGRGRGRSSSPRRRRVRT